MNDEDAYFRECRNDVLIQDENDNFFELNFHTLASINDYFARSSKLCFFWDKLIIVEDIKKATICDCISYLHTRQFYKIWEPISQEYLEKHYYPKENWEIFEVEVNENDFLNEF